jgi:ribose 5-phosphate isomerase B
MKLRIASDHAGFSLKEEIKEFFSDIEWVDLGTQSEDSCHYPEYASQLCQDILENTSAEQRNNPLGILICGSGVGMSIQANRFKGIRAALCWSEEISSLSRKHNAANVLCLASRHISLEVNLAIIKTWIQTPFEGGRHQQRVDMMG